MNNPTSLAAWIDSLRGQSSLSSDQRIRSIIDNPGEISAESAVDSTFDDTHRPPLPRTEAAIRAALSDTFNYSEIATEQSEDAERAILSNADTVMIAGRRRLRLRTDARAELLNRSLSDEALHHVLRELMRADQDDFDSICDDEIRRNNAWLRCFIKGDFAQLEHAPVSELRSALCAREQLAGVTLPSNVPAPAEVQRHLGLAELLEPLRILIGSTGGWNGVDLATDRFVGRRAELEALRTHVDELGSEGGRELIQRAIGRITDRLGAIATGRLSGVFVICGQGGLGKSALVAKFVLDHVRIAQGHFPFCYIDFDRAALQSRDARILLMEVLRQLALQFPRHAAHADQLRHSIRFELQQETLATVTSETPRNFDWPAARKLLRTVCHGRTFMLVLDTMEIVQNDERSMRGVEDFISLLCDESFPEARIVLAGRADVKQLREGSHRRSEGKLLKLSPLGIEEAKEMAELLGKSWLGEEWQPGWAARIAGRPNDPESRREPLTIRVAVDLVRAAQSEQRDALTRDIQKLGEKASDRFVGTLYERRVLDHVQDDEVRKLAWPGLVLRRVNLAIVNEVLAELCELRVADIPETFAALAGEAWIVIRDGETLKHQPELRARTLPLMRRSDKIRFAAVNRRAIKYFAKNKDVDLASRAEWIYHRLLGGEKPDRIESDWSRELVPYLIGAEADFDPKSAAYQFLFAHTAIRLSSNEADVLPATLAIEHIANTAPYLGKFYEERSSEVLQDLELDKVEKKKLSIQAQMSFDTLAVKTGRWDLVDLDYTKIPDNAWTSDFEYAAKFLRARKRNVPGRLFSDVESVEGPFRGGLAAAIQQLARRRRPGNPANVERTEAEILEVLDVLQYGKWRPEPEHAHTLRTAMVFSPRLTRLAGRSWLALNEHARRRDPIARAYSGTEIRALALPDDRLSRALRDADRESWKHVFEADHQRAILITNTDACLTIRDCLREYVEKRDDLYSLHALRKFAAARSSDWVVPLAYACHRGVEGGLPRDLHITPDYYDLRRHSSASWTNIRGDRRPVATDYLQMLNLADAAGDLYRATVMIETYPIQPDAQTKELSALTSLLGHWLKDIDILLEQEQP